MQNLNDMKRIIFTLLLISTQAFAGGGWPQPKGGGYFKLSQNIIRSSYFYSPDGSLVEITTVQLFTTSLYGEYGFSNRLTGLLYFPFFVRNTLNEIQYNQSGTSIPGDSFQSIGDTDIGMKYGLIINKPVVVSATVILGLPLGEPVGGASQILQTGDGEFNQIIKVDASYSWYPKPVYASVYAAFNNRTNSFSDEVRFGAEVGLTFKKFIPILKLNVVQSLYNGTAEEAQNGIFSNNTEYVSPTIELNYQPTSKWGLSGSGGFALSGKNILAAPNWSMGIYLKL